MESSFFSRLNSWMSNSIGLKIFAIGFLMLILMIPSSIIDGVIREREMRSSNVKIEVASKWANSQVLTGPILNVPYATEYKNGTAHFLPETLQIDGVVEPEIRSRSIYELVLYTTDLNISGSFLFPDVSVLKLNSNYFLWEKAYVSMGITDMKGISENFGLDWNGEKLSFEPGIPDVDLFDSGVNAPIKIANNNSGNDKYDFKINLRLNGSEWLAFNPVGKTTVTNLNSSWANPSFDGAFLPTTRDISKEGFTASWNVLHFNRSFPQEWLDATYGFSSTRDGKGFDETFVYGNEFTGGQPQLIAGSAFGVNLLLPVDTYQKNTRAVKYALMMIFLTFLSFFFIEIFQRKRVHPLQYLLVGFAICLFYLLLLSLSEYIAFALAYLVATIATVVLVAAYSRAVFRSLRSSGLVALILVALYGFFYSLLQLQDYALLVGSVGLFVILALVMFLSRSIDWYNLGQNRSEKN
ncbi:MAG: hypothetical protein UT55_C0017G0015 [Candidatus Peregrinibacteria bacterium GW2011_GWE2_39_6]|nr:MAG: hypothetical protein UT36_C0004G0009 [Candidatus Peregrinibacteria bacterium GW2011_GWF2_39_17]KKR26119.1 MAG: hypothetical protein UT55_C0017G0015 [Candidatus Peregrinibacteria bacterium GW2011_GWE2_39_6]HCW32705.1 cell envelope integrity protein CreD [Candidatus Peregrinibacteria bacterium]